MPDWSQLRAQFPALASWTYLDTATFGQIPAAAREAVDWHLTHRDQTASTHFLSWFDHMDTIRGLVGKLIHADAADIAFLPSASTGLAWLMNGLDWQPGDEVLTLENEFPNQSYQSAACARLGVVFRTTSWSGFDSALTDKTRLVLLSTVNYADGFRIPLAQTAAGLRERGTLLYVDGTQSIGALQFDTSRIRPSMLCVDAYKWLLSPNGAGFAYIDPALRERMRPSVIGWRSDAGWRHVNNLNHGIPVLPDGAERYEGGMLCFPSLYAMGAVLSLLLETGPELIEARVLELADKLRSMLRNAGADVNNDDSQIVTAALPAVDAALCARRLRGKQVVISARHGRLRISPHFYNNEDDVEALRGALPV